MTLEEIQARGAVEALRFSTAQKIRELLDEARSAAEKVNIDPDDFESEIIELVAGDP